MKTKFLKIWMRAVLLGSLINLPVLGITYYSRPGTNLDWHSKTSWSTIHHSIPFNIGTYPKQGDIVYIRGTKGTQCDMEIRNDNAVCSQITVWGNGDGPAYLEVENGKSLTVNGNVILNAAGGKRIIHLHLDTEYGLAGNITINGNLNILHNSGSENIYVILESVGVMTINGNLNMIYGGGVDANDDIIIDNKDNAQLIVNGNINMTHSAGPGDINFSLSNNAIVDVSGNTNFITKIQNKIVITLNHNNNKYYTGGNFVRGVFPNNYGKINCLQNSTIIYDGSTAQTFAESVGAGADGIIYQNVLINNTFGTIPQLQLENNEGGGATINKTITFRDGILRLGSQKLIIAGNGNIAEGSNNSWIDATITNGGVVQKNVTGTFNLMFPVGDSDEYSPFTFDLNAVGGADFISICVSDNKHLKISNTFNDFITRFWRVNSSGFNAASKFKVSYFFVDSDIVGTENSIAMAKWNGSTWSTYNLANSPVNNLFTSTNISEPPLNHDFTGLSPAPLPIELLSFTGVFDKGVTNLKWETLTENNNKGFTVQISENASEFMDIGFVTGAGNSNESKVYSFTDMSKKNVNIYYYRLKTEDYAGRAEYSKSISVVCSTDVGELVISPLYPNPVINGNSKVNITLPTDGKLKINIYNMKGQKINEQEIDMKQGTSEIEIMTDNLEAGTYAFTLNFDMKFTSGKFTHLSNKPLKKLDDFEEEME